MDLRRHIQRGITGLHTRIYRASGGRIGGRLGKAENILLTTVGRRSGQQRVTPLIGVPDGAAVVLVASNGGAVRHPDWYLNLTDEPAVTVQQGKTVRQMRARTATEAERTRLWPGMVAVYGSFASYQEKTSRQIPLVICEPNT